MSGNDAVLVGMKEIAAYLRVSEHTVRLWRSRYPDMPVFAETPGARVCADKETLGRWQRALFSGCVAS